MIWLLHGLKKRCGASPLNAFSFTYCFHVCLFSWVELISFNWAWLMASFAPHCPEYQRILCQECAVQRPQRRISVCLCWERIVKGGPPCTVSSLTTSIMSSQTCRNLSPRWVIESCNTVKFKTQTLLHYQELKQIGNADKMSNEHNRKGAHRWLQFLHICTFYFATDNSRKYEFQCESLQPLDRSWC